MSHLAYKETLLSQMRGMGVSQVLSDFPQVPINNKHRICSMESIFCRKLDLWRTHSIENTFYGKHILSIALSIESIFCRELDL
jgi:hypothetical protein